MIRIAIVIARIIMIVRVIIAATKILTIIMIIMLIIMITARGIKGWHRSWNQWACFHSV